MKNYWSCSKFADWIRGTPTLKAGTAKEWREWKRTAKQKRFRYWLAEEALDAIQNVIYWPRSLLKSIRCYIDNRWISKTHALTSDLKRGQRHEFNTRLLHAAFDSMVDFVEIEQAWFHMICSEEAYKKYHTPWYHAIFRRGKWRCPESGLEYLHWAASLRYDEDWIDKEDPDFAKPTHQALAAQETIALYNWWKEVRPHRPDPIEASGWSAYYDERQNKAKELGDDSTWLDFSEYETDEDKERSRQILELSHKMESQQEEEDTEMLIRLVKVRQHLWT